MAANNAELEAEVQQLERQFWLDRDKLQNITRRFIDELKDGLEENGRNIAMNITWVFGFPTGYEQGSFLALDLESTNIRLCWIELAERRGEMKVVQEKYRLPEDLKTGNAYELWFFIAEVIERFMRAKKLKPSRDNPLPLGFTFSWPASQDYIDHGILQTWTKGFDIDGVEGHDVAEQVQSAINKRVRTFSLLH
jgi:hexokinase